MLNLIYEFYLTEWIVLNHFYVNAPSQRHGIASYIRLNKNFLKKGGRKTTLNWKMGCCIKRLKINKLKKIILFLLKTNYLNLFIKAYFEVSHQKYNINGK